MAMLWVTISQVCDESRPAVLSALAGLGAEKVEDRVKVQEAEGRQVVALLGKALAGSGYVAVENMQDASEIAVLKEGDIEQLGLYLCGYCAMVFRSDLERNLHQRVHYFGFG
ncbi:MAG: hypothetical protein ACREAY_02535 [Nitrososphaera sp.]|uniref:hypothetical protein n=1 Tax=Nitrososphaera sp. TaxID=1971748 RepID=UPI003D6F7DBB